MNAHHQHPAQIGAAFEHGRYGGLILINAALHAIVWAPKAEGETTAVWLPENKAVAGASSCFDSVANTLAMAEAGSPLAQWATGLRIGGADDWCIPARDVLELGYRHIKPTAYPNYCSFRDGDNASSVPAGYPYTKESPVQTSASDFRDGAPEAFEEAWYWSSTQYSARGAHGQNFGDGVQYDNYKSYEARARAVRLIRL